MPSMLLLKSAASKERKWRKFVLTNTFLCKGYNRELIRDSWYFQVPAETYMTWLECKHEYQTENHVHHEYHEQRTSILVLCSRYSWCSWCSWFCDWYLCMHYQTVNNKVAFPNKVGYKPRWQVNANCIAFPPTPQNASIIKSHWHRSAIWEAIFSGVAENHPSKIIHEQQKHYTAIARIAVKHTNWKCDGLWGLMTVVKWIGGGVVTDWSIQIHVLILTFDLNEHI